ncbi:hypothetical protein ACH5RR_041460 [Cinchona calisaya]|uniref:Uncharacterized protein n=1 Tax=Cinchona calisaya TaxID=153742 RepID=A0ABD2XUW7_9GENT
MVAETPFHCDVQNATRSFSITYFFISKATSVTTSKRRGRSTIPTTLFNKDMEEGERATRGWVMRKEKDKGEDEDEEEREKENEKEKEKGKWLQAMAR